MPSRIEPAFIEEASAPLADVIADLSASAAVLGKSLHPRTAASLADQVRIMNSYYSNLIEGHNTRPREIQQALAGELAVEPERRNLQIEAAAHVRVQRVIDQLFLDGTMPRSTSGDFLKWIHFEFYKELPPELLAVRGRNREIVMIPGEWRSFPEHDNAVGRHLPPSSERVVDFMNYFARRYDISAGRDTHGLGRAQKIIAVAAAHHRLNYIHPFPDGNGRVSRLMSHAMSHEAGIGANGLWSISRGLARGLKSRTEYKQMMDYADTPRQGDLDGRGNLSLKALKEFVLWFLQVCLDQIQFMSSLFDLDHLRQRVHILVERDGALAPQARYLLEEALIRGEFERGEVSRLTGLKERSGRTLLGDLIDRGLLASATPKGAVSLRFPNDALEVLFPRLYPQT